MRKVSTKNDLSEEEYLKNRGYTIKSKINEGSFAKIYVAEFIAPSADSTPHRTTKLAAKVLNAKSKPEEVRKFLVREINILSQIDHPHIIHVHSILQIGYKFFIFMRFAELGDLFDFMLQNGRVNENQARVWAHQIALAIQYLHIINIAHRDLKCENVLITINYNAKLTDFGFARFSIDSNRKDVLSETYCGTLTYASPEVLHGQPYNPKIADLWSLGVVIFVMLNKALPYENANVKIMYQLQMARSFRFRYKIVKKLSNEVITLIRSLLEPNPLNRCSIEKVLNSDWIAMDKQLQELSPLESAAKSDAAQYQITTIDNFSFPDIKSKKSDTIGKVADQGNRVEISEVQLYNKCKQEESRMQRITSLDNHLVAPKTDKPKYTSSKNTG